ncbi:hypothetical protein KC328_g12633, partial [Hortaea werneckii]
MADADEDVIPRSGPMAEEVDLSEETQDFRFLAAVGLDEAKIPKRGEKDFEPHATALQSNTLAASRQAMHNALSFQRVHQAKGYTVATYHPETNMAYTYNPKGVLFSRIGQIFAVNEDPLGNENRGSRMWLLPEEVLFLLERGAIDVRWPPEEADEDPRGLPMSLQGAYAVFIGDEEAHAGALSFERFSVYSGLRRMGYTVHRAPTWAGPGPPSAKECFAPLTRRTWQAGLFSFAEWCAALFSQATTSKSQDEQLLSPGPYRSYADIYRRLALINWHDPTTSHEPSYPHIPSTDDAFRVTYYVWKPGSKTYKKRDPGPPDFRIAVVNGRETTIPALEQLSALMETVPYDPPREDSQLYQKLRWGYKSVILAIVDQGITSYLRVADACFGREKLYERKPR